MLKADPLRQALAAAADTRRRVGDLRARVAPVPFPVIRAFIDALQENFLASAPLFGLAARGINIQALADAQMVEAPANVMATFGAVQAAGQALVTVYVTQILPLYQPQVVFDAATGLHVDTVLPWGAMAPLMAPLADLDAALAEIG